MKLHKLYKPHKKKKEYSSADSSIFFYEINYCLLQKPYPLEKCNAHVKQEKAHNFSFKPTGAENQEVLP